MKQFCMKIDLISQRKENVLFLPLYMAAMTSHENALFLVKPTTKEELRKRGSFLASEKPLSHNMSCARLIA